MRLEGWNHIPEGYGAVFLLAAAPWWLRLWFNTPFIDRYAHPRVVARGYGFLSPHPRFAGRRETPGAGRRILPPDYVLPGSQAELRPTDS